MQSWTHLWYSALRQQKKNHLFKSMIYENLLFKNDSLKLFKSHCLGIRIRLLNTYFLTYINLLIQIAHLYFMIYSQQYCRQIYICYLKITNQRLLIGNNVYACIIASHKTLKDTSTTKHEENAEDKMSELCWRWRAHAIKYKYINTLHVPCFSNASLSPGYNICLYICEP